VIGADAARAGGQEQLRALLTPLGVTPETASTPSELRAAAVAADTLTLIDTSGINPFRGEEVARLAQWLGAAECEPVLTLAAGTDAQDALEMVGVFATLGVRRCLVTRLDVARRFGAVIAAGIAGIALAEASVSPLIGKAMPALTAPGLARLLLRHRERG
jgi:flagellar biosynthesis protein FlhF